jgi:hypothetical protein
MKQDKYFINALNFINFSKSFHLCMFIRGTIRMLFVNRQTKSTQIIILLLRLTRINC